MNKKQFKEFRNFVFRLGLSMIVFSIALSILARVYTQGLINYIVLSCFFIGFIIFIFSTIIIFIEIEIKNFILNSKKYNKCKCGKNKWYTAKRCRDCFKKFKYKKQLGRIK
jgi:hypothetical protein